VTFRKKQNHNNRHYYGKNPNAKSNRFRHQKVAKSKLLEERRRVYNECLAKGMTDMQALIKCLEISTE
jgi:hypothetical protein